MRWRETLTRMLHLIWKSICVQNVSLDQPGLTRDFVAVRVPWKPESMNCVLLCLLLTHQSMAVKTDPLTSEEPEPDQLNNIESFLIDCRWHWFKDLWMPCQSFHRTASSSFSPYSITSPLRGKGLQKRGCRPHFHCHGVGDGSPLCSPHTCSQAFRYLY